MKKSLQYFPLIHVFVLFASIGLISCNDSEFKGTAKTTLIRADDEQIQKFTETPCVDQNKATVAPNLVIAIDNSASNGSASIATDCPNMSQIRYLDGSVGYQCNSATMREAAVKDLVTSLQGIAADEPNNPLAASNIAITAYPTANYSSWNSVQQLNDTNLDQILAFTRRPAGDTTLGTAIDRALSLGQIADQTNDRKTMYVFISDGFPTDENVDLVAQKALQLNSLADVFVITNTSGSNYDLRSQDFRNILSQRSYFSEAWYSKMIGYSESEGMMNDLADQHFVVDAASQVPQILDYIVKSSGGIQCVDAENAG